MEEFKIDPTISYDVVELPSRGIHYPSKKKSVRVAYLTASDENIISSPNLISTGKVIEELLKRKILDKDVPVDEIVEEDRQAILIFLRNTAFGSQYSLTLNDPKTKEKFKVDVDLSSIKIKEFTLKEDTNGEYSYFLKKANFSITFKFLTKKQEEELESMQKNWNGLGVAPVKTKKLEMLIKSLNGNRNPMEIHSFIENKMQYTDSQDFQDFVDENRPGLDLSTKVTAPSGEEVQVYIGFGAEFFRPFYRI